MGTGVDVAVLGPISVRLRGAEVDFGTPKQRALLAALALAGGHPVSVDRLVDLLWGEAAPPAVTASLQAYVSALRRVLEPERARRAPASVLVTVAPGYALCLGEGRLDASLLEEEVTAAHRLLGGADGWQSPAVGADTLSETVRRLDEALAGWRGTPYAELGDAPDAVAERARLEELRLLALEARARAGLALGRHQTVAAELEALTARHPLREQLWGLHALALTRSGRQAEALEVLASVRRLLDEELGLEPSAQLRDLQTAVLRQDPDLAWRPPAAPAAAPPAAALPVVPPVVPASPATPRPVVARAPAGIAAWMLVGRVAERDALLSALARAEAGTPTAVVLTGEPGIGKTRLAAELLAECRRRGHRVLTGRCSQDDGAPPLWPWRAVLAGMDRDVPAVEGTASGFAGWEAISEALRAAARDQVVVLALDDLHWADTASLRALRLLVDTAKADERLLVLATWRAAPPPSGALADTAETFARRHAVRLELGGLEEPEAARLLAEVAGAEIPPALVPRLLERTGGNPFFLAELARLAAAGRGPVALEDDLPAGVTEVLGRRLGRLPDTTQVALRAAAVVGRRFDLDALAGTARVDVDDLLDLLDPAVADGLLREVGVERFEFAHALVRDTLLAAVPATRLARLHARAAEVLAGVPGRETEVARHWLAAGPGHAGRAWRAARTAAEIARSLHAHDDAADLLDAALGAMTEDPEAAPRERYDLLMDLVEAHRWATDLPALVAAVEAAVTVARDLADPAALTRAATATTLGGLWRSAPAGQVNTVVEAALRTALDQLPDGDGELRCTAMLALANETEPSTTRAERRALLDAAVAMADRLGDPRLAADARKVAFVVLWTPETVTERLRVISEAVDLSRRAGDDRGAVVALTLRAVVLGELGRRAEMHEAAASARAEASRLRIAFGEVIVDALEVPWWAMSGDTDAAEAALGRIRAQTARLSHVHVDESVFAAEVTLRAWQGRAADVVPQVSAFAAETGWLLATAATLAWQAGDEATARRLGADVVPDPDAQATLEWGHAAEVALRSARPPLAAEAYRLLAPHAGTCCAAGASMAWGPVDAYLAMAAAATGERALARKHADAAERIAEQWGIATFLAWFRDLRAAHGFGPA